MSSAKVRRRRLKFSFSTALCRVYREEARIRRPTVTDMSSPHCEASSSWLKNPESTRGRSRMAITIFLSGATLSQRVTAVSTPAFRGCILKLSRKKAPAERALVINSRKRLRSSSLISPSSRVASESRPAFMAVNSSGRKSALSESNVSGRELEESVIAYWLYLKSKFSKILSKSNHYFCIGSDISCKIIKLNKIGKITKVKPTRRTESVRILSPIGNR